VAIRNSGMSTKRWITLCVACTLLAPASLHGAATIAIINADAANVGFNDSTPVAPVGGNMGTTLGQQRMNVFTAVAAKWGATLTSAVTIQVRATWSALTCTTNSAVLGSAGASGVFRDFQNAPVAGHWYSAALANKLAGMDLDPSNADINANFNLNLGQPGCLTGIFFYLGLDNNHGSSIDLYTVVLHEMAHGLGFQTFTSGSSGSQLAGFPSIWDDFILDNTTNKTWSQMTAAERVASAVNTGHLVWNGPNVIAAVPQVLQGAPGNFTGADSQQRARLYAPGSFQGGSSVSHYDTVATPNQLMEPAINSNLTHEVTPPIDMTFSLLADTGWGGAAPKKRRGQLTSQ
jgi:hypothetical protein